LSQRYTPVEEQTTLAERGIYAVYVVVYGNSSTRTFQPKEMYESLLMGNTEEKSNTVNNVEMWINERIFAQLAEENFLFLQNEFGMKTQEKRTAECVCFKSSVTWVEIWFDKYSLSVEMGTNDGLYQASLWDILQLTSEEGRSASYMATDEEKLTKGLKLLSGYVKQYCNKALSGDIEFYKELQRIKEERNQEYAYKNRIISIEEQAKTAWDNQNYKEIIRLYRPILEHLSPLQKKRLEICMKKLR